MTLNDTQLLTLRGQLQQLLTITIVLWSCKHTMSAILGTRAAICILIGPAVLGVWSKHAVFHSFRAP